MGKVIRENKQLKRKTFNRRNRALNNYNRWKNIQNGDGVIFFFFKQRIPTIIQKDRDVSLAPSTISYFNNGKVQYRGEKTIQDGIGFFLVLHNSYNVILEGYNLVYSLHHFLVIVLSLTGDSINYYHQLMIY